MEDLFGEGHTGQPSGPVRVDEALESNRLSRESHPGFEPTATLEIVSSCCELL